MSVLLLNATYEPLRVTPTFRAIQLMLEGKVDVVEALEGRKIRSATQEWEMPSVVRLRRYVNVPRHRHPPLNRRTLLARDNHECAYCEEEGTTIDHVIPTSRGGAHDWRNVVASCYRCNHRKGDRTPEEMGLQMRFQPFVPPAGRWLVVGSHERDRWREYLEY